MDVKLKALAYILENQSNVLIQLKVNPLLEKMYPTKHEPTLKFSPKQRKGSPK